MENNSLTDAVRLSAETLGYRFYTGCEIMLAAGVAAAEAVWMPPPVLKNASGRSECRDTYVVTLYFMKRKVAGAPGSEGIIGMLETDALSVYRRLHEYDRVRATRGLKVSPQMKPLTVHGETAVKAEFEVEMFYYNYR